MTTASQPIRAFPTVTSIATMPPRAAAAMAMVFHSAQSSRMLISVPMWTMIRYMEMVATGLPMPAFSTTSSGNHPYQNPRRNSRAATNTDGTKAFVFVETMSPIARMTRTTKKLMMKDIRKTPFNVFAWKYGVV